MAVITMMTLFLSMFASSFVLTGLVRRFALWRHELAMPEFRHGPLEPTPRGGGIALIITMLGLFLLLYRYGLVDLHTTRSLCWAGITVTLGCVIHEVRALDIRIRLAIQALAAYAALQWYQPDLILMFFDSYLYLSGWWLLLVGVALVWFINLFNFMNGIDGFVGSQVFILIFGSACLLAISDELAWTVPLMLLCAPVLGFLAWNWPPAKIFMGEAGASFLGIVMPIVGMHLAAETGLNLWSWFILMGWFVVDGAWSLVVRIFKAQDWHRSHRMHAYQILARRWESHFYVTLLLWLISWGWLFPLAYLAMEFEGFGSLLLLAAYLPLMGACWYLEAGQPKELPPEA